MATLLIEADTRTIIIGASARLIHGSRRIFFATFVLRYTARLCSIYIYIPKYIYINIYTLRSINKRRSENPEIEKDAHPKLMPELGRPLFINNSTLIV